jgi:hypothetical protein
VPAGPVPTAAQQAVIDQPWDARVLVTAGAGTGKTFALVRRLDALMEREELAAQEILVLTFSRAAVRELQQRVELRAGGARRVRAQTFDSWAAGLVREAYGEEQLAGTGFDGRIALAARALEAGVLEQSEAGVPAHVLIDEVQDLVGVRRVLVETLLERFAENLGFTLVGDPAQFIYGFQVQDPEQRALEAGYIFDQVRRSFEEVTDIRLEEHFRARTPGAAVALPMGARLQRLSRDPGEVDAEARGIHRELRALLMEAPDFGGPGDPLTRIDLDRFEGSTAILCRTNGQALLLSGQLAEAGIEHHLQRSTRDRPIPRWVARVLVAVEARSITEGRFVEVLGESAAIDEAEAVLLWRSVRKIAGAARGTLDLARLHRAAAEGRLPDELTVPASSRLVVSTVHRAKGLEFDRVVVVDPGPLGGKGRKDVDAPADTRALFVAMTRPRDDLYRIDAPNTDLVRQDPSSKRWYVASWKRGGRTGIEATGGDVCHERPPGASLTGRQAMDVPDLQRRLHDEIPDGDPVELRMPHLVPQGEYESPPFMILHRGRPVGEVSSTFRKAVQGLLAGATSDDVRKWPARITGLRIECVESVAGSAAASERAGLGPHGAWLAPRLVGLGRFDWKAPPLSELPEGSGAL